MTVPGDVVSATVPMIVNVCPPITVILVDGLLPDFPVELPAGILALSLLLTPSTGKIKLSIVVVGAAGVKVDVCPPARTRIGAGVGLVAVGPAASGLLPGRPFPTSR